MILMIGTGCDYTQMDQDAGIKYVKFRLILIWVFDDSRAACVGPAVSGKVDSSKVLAFF